VADNLSQAISAVDYLYEATNYKEPEWIETLANQLKTESLSMIFT